MDIFCKVTPCGLVPLHDSDLDLKKRLRVGSVVRCKVSNPRNYEHHKKFFALVRLTFDNLPLPLVEKWNIRNEYDMLPLWNSTNLSSSTISASTSCCSST